MILLIKRLIRVIRRDGLLCIKKIFIQIIRTLNFKEWKQKKIFATEEKEFDKKWGVDTSGIISQAAFKTNNPNQIHAERYQGSSATIFKKAILSLQKDFRKFIFIDFGSGKGRILLKATEFKFKQIIGVEFIEKLHIVAYKNTQHCKTNNIYLYCMDVTEYPIPSGHLVCYFYNPFKEVVMSKVVANLRQAHQTEERNIIIVYYKPDCGRLFDNEDWLRYSHAIGPVKVWTN